MLGAYPWSSGLLQRTRMLYLLVNKVVYKHVSMTSLLALRKPTYSQSLMMMYGFLFELWVLNLNKEEEEEEEKKKMKNSTHHSPIHL